MMCRSPLFSAVVPCFNGGEFLLEAIASIEASEGVGDGAGGCEIAIVDDGSTDPFTLRLLDYLRDRGYALLRQPHRGLAAARNAGIAAARGEYIIPVDADNRLRPEFLGACRAAFEGDRETGVVYGDVWLFGDATGRRTVPAFDRDRLARSNYIDACAAFRRVVWEDCGGYDPTLPALEDWDFWLSAAAAGWRFARWDGIAFDYRVRPGSLSDWCQQADRYRPLADRIRQKTRPGDRPRPRPPRSPADLPLHPDCPNPFLHDSYGNR